MSENQVAPPVPPPIPAAKSTGYNTTDGKRTGHPFAESLRKAKQRSRLIGAVAAVVVIAGLGYYFYAAGRGNIVILDSSSDLSITINNQKIQPKKEKDGYRIPAFAGTYRLQIIKTNYLPFIQDVTLNRGQTLSIRPAFAFQPTSQKNEVSTVDYVRPSLDQRSIFYLGDNRKTIYRMEIANQVKIPLTDPILKGVTDVQWSSEPDVALITQSDGIYLREIPRFDYQHQTLVRLGGSELVSPVWDPLNPERIALAYFPSSGERSLVFTDKRLGTLDRKADIKEIPNPKLIWSPDDKYILLIGRGADTSANNVWIYNSLDGSVGRITEGGGILDASFSPDSGTILYEKASTDSGDKFSSTLSVMKVDGSEKKALNVTGKVARSAWKDSSTFYLPSGDNSLAEYSSDGTPRKISFNFPENLSIQGMVYFESNKTLVFYTPDTIYTVELAL